MVGMAEVEVDKETGSVQVVDYVAVVDCGTPINPNLARTDRRRDCAGNRHGALRGCAVYRQGQDPQQFFHAVQNSQPSGTLAISVWSLSAAMSQAPLAQKSIGELVIDTPCPAIAAAVYNATGVRVRELPITPEKIAMGILQKEREQS